MVLHDVNYSEMGSGCRQTGIDIEYRRRDIVWLLDL